MSNKSEAHARAYLIGYMSTRCRVTSQHKLPSREELLDHTVMADYFGHDVMAAALDALLASGAFRVYSEHYISDREVDVL
jgi:hypothetical protein